jgi:hypothetical protein
MKRIATKKTNKQWYPYKEFGSYYKLEDGELWCAPMLKGGAIDMDGDQVNFGVVEYIEDRDKARMAEIVKELEEKE